jgi:hypothetical protein
MRKYGGIQMEAWGGQKRLQQHGNSGHSEEKFLQLYKK